MAEPLQANAGPEVAENYDGAASGGDALSNSRPAAFAHVMLRNNYGLRISPDVNAAASPSHYDTEERVVPGRKFMTREEKAALIPDWAALMFACGILVAIIGFVTVWLFDSAIPLILMAVGFASGAAAIRIARCKTATVQIN